MEFFKGAALSKSWIAIVFVLLLSGPVFGGGDKEPAEINEPLPLSKVVLFSTGVGYFQRNAVIEGDASIDLFFDVKDVNDLLKSMILVDLDGGTINSVNYASREPINQALRSMSIDIASNPGFVHLLNQLRGQEVSLTLKEGKSILSSGSIIGIEQKMNNYGRTTPHVNLFTLHGIRSFDIENIRSIVIKDVKLKRELQDALGMLKDSLKPDKKRVTINFSGNGKRQVQIGYLLETPVWKTAYRLSLDESEGHYLQGWAIIENTTDTKWDNVALTLVAGRPISFIMDLYSPIFQSRPRVALEVYSALKPQSYEAEKRRAVAAPEPAPEMAAPSMRSSAMADDMALEYGGGDFLAEEEISLNEGVTSAAQAQRAGDFFKYAIKEPITLPGKETAMVPIITESIQGERISFYNANSHPVHPFNTVKLLNSTGFDLMPGPITVFAEGNYAGDARISSMPAQAEQYISFSLDLNTSIESEFKTIPDSLEKSTISSGTLELEMLSRREVMYRAFAGPGKQYDLVIEHPILQGWELVSEEKPVAETAHFYRFRLSPSESVRVLDLAFERQSTKSFALISISDSALNRYINMMEINDRVKRALRGIVERRDLVKETSRLLKVQERSQNDIYREQGRIRDNLARLDKASEMYARYEKLLGEQEDELAIILAEIDSLRNTLHQRKEDLEQYILSLQVN